MSCVTVQQILIGYYLKVLLVAGFLAILPH